MQASRTELTYKNRRLTRKLWSSALTCAITLSPSQVKGRATCRRGKRGSKKKKKEAAKGKSSMVRRKKHK